MIRVFVYIDNKQNSVVNQPIYNGTTFWYRPIIVGPCFWLFRPQTTVVVPICSIETCMHIINLCRSITNQTNLVCKKHFERDRLSLFKQHVARLPLPRLKVKVQVYEYHRKSAPTIREKLCKQTLIMHILTYKIHQNTHESPISCSL